LTTRVVTDDGQPGRKRFHEDEAKTFVLAGRSGTHRQRPRAELVLLGNEAQQLYSFRNAQFPAMRPISFASGPSPMRASERLRYRRVLRPGRAGGLLARNQATDRDRDEDVLRDAEIAS